MPKDQGGQWLGGHDKNEEIFTPEREKNYFVFDWINGVKKYDVPRIEAFQNNKEIRFKIRGGEGEGMFLTINDYESDQELSCKKLSDYFDINLYKNTGVAWSSAMYTLEKHSN